MPLCHLQYFIIEQETGPFYPDPAPAVEEEYMTAAAFAERLTELRTKKGVTARDMSLSMGQNAAYINSIENGKTMPSLQGFFYICEYLGISERDFFDTGLVAPGKRRLLEIELEKMDDFNYNAMLTLARALNRR